MHGRRLRRATALAFAAVMIFAGTAFADQLLGDADLVKPLIQGAKFLGNYGPGAEVTADVEFTLTCVGLGHVDVGQTVLISKSDIESKPLDGAIVSVTPSSIGPITDGWGVDTQGCPSPVPSIVGATRSTVTLRAPTTTGNGYTYTIVYDRSLSPGNASDGSAFSRTATQVSFTLNVVGNTPPTLTVPPSVTVQGNTTGGWIADWSGVGVSATDPEDNPDPTPTCTPAAGNVVPFGTTNVSCSVIDSAGASATGGFTITVTNTAPTLTVPSSFSVEGNTTGGWLGPWTVLGATDVEDDPDPIATCDPVAGTVLPVGITTVTCSVTDSGRLTTSASFDVTVTDTTAPVLTNLTGDQTVPTSDPAGTTLVYAPPSAADIVDSHPVAACLPTSGTHIGVGTTTVNCTATDASGNTAHGSFDVTVVFVAPHTASAIWGEPIAGNGTTFIANRGRTIPLKVELFVDDVAATSGDASVTLSPCATGSGLILALTPGGGRWNASLDTTALDGSCYTVTASIDGLTAGAFRLELRGDPTPVRSKNSATASPLPKKTGQLKPR
jgi:HYR domain